jgi:outer membrane protein assembly factor BamE (lipoprotein component of BamABCDE complex)
MLMPQSTPRLFLLAGLATVLMATAGCSRIREHQGFILDRLMTDSIAAGVDNRASVEGTLGRPSFISQFGPESWYYISRETKSLAFGTPKPAEQLVLRVEFDGAGNVAKVENLGMEQIARIDPVGDKTPTLGRNRSLFDEIFGNIGAVGAGGGAAGGNPDNTGP